MDEATTCSEFLFSPSSSKAVVVLVAGEAARRVRAQVAQLDTREERERERASEGEGEKQENFEIRKMHTIFPICKIATRPTPSLWLVAKHHAKIVHFPPGYVSKLPTK